MKSLHPAFHNAVLQYQGKNFKLRKHHVNSTKKTYITMIKNLDSIQIGLIFLYCPFSVPHSNPGYHTICSHRDFLLSVTVSQSDFSSLWQFWKFLGGALQFRLVWFFSCCWTVVMDYEKGNDKAKYLVSEDRC